MLLTDVQKQMFLNHIISRLPRSLFADYKETGIDICDNAVFAIPVLSYINAFNVDENPKTDLPIVTTNDSAVYSIDANGMDLRIVMPSFPLSPFTPLNITEDLGNEFSIDISTPKEKQYSLFPLISTASIEYAPIQTVEDRLSNSFNNNMLKVACIGKYVVASAGMYNILFPSRAKNDILDKLEILLVFILNRDYDNTYKVIQGLSTYFTNAIAENNFTRPTKVEHNQVMEIKPWRL